MLPAPLSFYRRKMHLQILQPVCAFFYLIPDRKFLLFFKLVNFEDGYQTAMERYISQHVVPMDQERLRTVTKKEYVLAQLKEKKKFSVRYTL